MIDKNSTTNFMNKEKILFAEEVRERKYFNRRNIVYFFLGASATIVSIIALLYSWGFWEKDENGSLFSPSACYGKNIGVIKIIGDIDSTEDPDYYSVAAPDIIQQIEELENNLTIKGILVDIDSGGGTSVASESIMLALQRSPKPIVAIIQDIGASGAYLAATGADRIFASKFSSVGSIGVTTDFLDTSGQDRKNGVVFYDFSSGKYKGMAKDHSQMTTEQRNVIMEDIMKSHDIFVDYVSENRNMPTEKVEAMATGRTYHGDDALNLGLIDQIGGILEVGMWLEKTIGDKPNYCFAKE